MIHLSSTRFGDISLEDSAEIQFPSGLIGFSRENRFAILERTKGPIAYLQSLTTPRLALPVVDASILRPEYPAMSPEELAALTGIAPESTALLVVVAVDPFDTQLRANLLAPIVINVESRTGKQLIFEGTSYGASVPIGARKPVPQRAVQQEVAAAR